MKEDVTILDACCGARMFYFDKNDPRVFFQDFRHVSAVLNDGRIFSVTPDKVGDFRSMDFPDERFNMVIFDPPHLIHENPKTKPTGWQMMKYGWLTNDWRDTIRKGFSECFRVLKTGGFLIFKWNETDIPLKKILELTEYKPILGHRSGRQARTHWVLFMK